MQEHQKRVVTEKEELDNKLTKLISFFETPIFSGLDAAEQERLKRQSAIMTDYSVVLGERIAAFAE